MQRCIYKDVLGDFAGGPVVKNPASSAGDVGLISGQGTQIPHVGGQLRLCATTTEPVCSRACTPRLERSPWGTTKIPHAMTKT